MLPFKGKWFGWEIQYTSFVQYIWFIGDVNETVIYLGYWYAWVMLHILTFSFCCLERALWLLLLVHIILDVCFTPSVSCVPIRNIGCLWEVLCCWNNGWWKLYRGVQFFVDYLFSLLPGIVWPYLGSSGRHFLRD